MNSKKNLIIGAVIIVVLIAGVLLWRGGFLGKGAGTAQPGVEGQTNEQTTSDQAEMEKNLKMAEEVFKNESIGKMTFEIYVEIAAQITYLGLQNDADFKNSAELKKVLDKYGVTMNNFGAYGTKEIDFNDSARIDAAASRGIAENRRKVESKLQFTLLREDTTDGQAI